MKKNWQEHPDSSWQGTTTMPPMVDGIDLDADTRQWLLQQVRGAGAAMRAESPAPATRETDDDSPEAWAKEQHRLEAEAQRCLDAAGDANAALVNAALAIGYQLGRHYQNWWDKDRAQPDFDRGVADLRRRRHAAREATKEREERKGRSGWRDRALDLDANLRRAEPGLSKKERAESIRVRLGLSYRTIYDFLKTP